MDPNDIELTMLLEGMAVEKNGKVHKVKQIFFQSTEVFSWQKNDIEKKYANELKIETVYFVSHELYNLSKIINKFYVMIYMIDYSKI